jgi:hypothetical protein
MVRSGDTGVCDKDIDFAMFPNGCIRGSGHTGGVGDVNDFGGYAPVFAELFQGG